MAFEAQANAWKQLPAVSCEGVNPTPLPGQCDRETEESLKQRHTENSTLFPADEPCIKEAQVAIQCCTNPNNQEVCYYTKFDPPALPAQQGTIEGFDSAVENLVNRSNQLLREAFVCRTFLAACREKCKEKSNYYLENLHNFVGTPDEATFRQKTQQLIAMENICNQELEHKYVCAFQQGKSFQYDANKTLACSQPARQNQPQPTIICYTTTKRLEQCHYSGSSYTGFADLSDQEQYEANKDDVHDFGMVERANEDGTFDKSAGHCSGTPIGDGSQMITAAHCVNGDKPLNTVTVDVGGQTYTSRITCPPVPHYQGDVTNDTVLCNLESPIPVRDNVFVMTYDSQVPTGCIPEDYFLRCGQDAYLNLNNQPVKMISFPASQTAQDGSVPPIYSQGVATYNPNTGRFHTNVFGDYGSSGGGFLTEIDGRTVLVTNDAAIYYNSQQKTMPMITWETIQGMQTNLTTQKLAGGDAVFGVGP